MIQYHSDPKYCFGCGFKFGPHKQKGGILHHKKESGEWITGWKCTHCTAGIAYHPDQVEKWNMSEKRRELKRQIAQMPKTVNRRSMERERQSKEFGWLAIYIDDRESQELWGNFKSFRQWLSRYGYRQGDLGKAKAHRREQIGEKTNI